MAVNPSAAPEFFENRELFKSWFWIISKDRAAVEPEYTAGSVSGRLRGLISSTIRKGALFQGTAAP
jgi:hypothetical protein